MIFGWELKSRAGQLLGLLFLFIAAFELCAAESSQLVFQWISSTCIDLAHYETNMQQLTVRFTGGNPGKFYRYSNVTTNIWTQILQANEKGGGVGSYFVETVVNHPKAHPYEILWISMPTTAAKSKKAGNSK